MLADVARASFLSARCQNGKRFNLFHTTPCRCIMTFAAVDLPTLLHNESNRPLRMPHFYRSTRGICSVDNILIISDFYLALSWTRNSPTCVPKSHHILKASVAAARSGSSLRMSGSICISC